LKEGFYEIYINFKGLIPNISGIKHPKHWYEHFSYRSRFFRIYLPILILIYLATGFKVVPIGGSGYVRVFGHVVWRDWQPGLYYIPPAPIAKMDIWFPSYPQQVNVGIFTPESQHTTEKNKRPLAEFLSGDENLLNLVISAQYIIKDPYKYYYQINNPESVITDYLDKSVLDAAATEPIMDLLTFKRGSFEKAIADNMQAFINNPKFGFGDLGIELVSVNVVDLHPPQESLYAFRDVMSAREDRESSNLTALATLIQTVLRSRGDASVEVEQAKGFAYAEEAEAQGKEIDITARAEVVSQHRPLLENLLWIQTSERALSKPDLYLLPPGNPPQGFKLWRQTGTQNISQVSKKEHQAKEKKGAEHETKNESNETKGNQAVKKEEHEQKNKNEVSQNKQQAGQKQGEKKEGSK
jgi:membrane protease subunit HflK